MPRRLLLALCSTVALAQVQVRQPDPVDLANRAYWDARNSGNFDQAAARREDARALAAKTPLDSPLWLNSVRQVVQLYQGADRRLQARTVIEDAVSRSAALGDSHPSRILLWNMLADALQQDGNLLKALPYREKAVAAFEAAPPSSAADKRQELMNSARFFQVAGGGISTGAVSVNRFVYSGSTNSFMYQQLADLYRQLGMTEAAAKTRGKMRGLLKDDPMALASSYEQEGDLDQAAALYRKRAEEGNSPESIRALQSLANLYQRQQKWDEAAAALEQTAARTEASGTREARGQQAAMIRLNLANLLQQAGKGQAAEQLYQTLLRETASGSNSAYFQVLQSYANHLSRTDRAAQAEDLLKDYLATRSTPGEEAMVLASLSNVARAGGRQELANEYQRKARDKQQPNQSRPGFPDGPLIGPELQKAQEALGRGNVDEAVNRTLSALGSAWLARDGEQIAWQVPGLASQLAAHKAPDKGEALFRQLIPVLQARAVDNAGPLLQAMHQYAYFLMGQTDRWTDAPAAIDRYGETLAGLQGAETHAMQQVFQLRIDFARRRGEHAAAVRHAEELLAYEESLSGNKSAPYLQAAQIAAGIFVNSGNVERGLALYREIIPIADATLNANDPQRGLMRINAAMAYAHARRFDEAERLAAEVQAFGERIGNKVFSSQIDQIRMMKKAAEQAPAQQQQMPDATSGGEGKWFRQGSFQKVAAPPPPPPVIKQ